MLRSALRIDDIDQLRLSPHEGISVIWVDISERPDLAALAVQSAHASSEAVHTCFSGTPGTQNMLVGLHIVLKRPTTAVFTLVFPLERFVGHLLTIAKYGKLWIVPGPPFPHVVGTEGMDAQTFLTHIARYAGQGVLLELESPLVRALRTQRDEWRQTMLPVHAWNTGWQEE
jgi:hypothetical protein